MRSLRLVLGDQLNQTISSLEGCDPGDDDFDVRGLGRGNLCQTS